MNNVSPDGFYDSTISQRTLSLESERERSDKQEKKEEEYIGRDGLHPVTVWVIGHWQLLEQGASNAANGARFSEGDDTFLLPHLLGFVARVIDESDGSI